MPELPEVETVCRTLQGPLTGRSISAVEVFWPRTVEPLSPPEFIEKVLGSRIDCVYRRAKFIVFKMSGGDVLTTHLRMTGKLLYVDAASTDIDEPAHHLRATFQLGDRGRLDFYDARKFGRIRHLSHGDWEQLSNSLGPEPLDANFTTADFYERLQVVKRQIKPLLLDQTFIAGIGNIYADEALYKARIHPRQTSSTISRRKAVALHRALIETLVAALENQGTTIRDYRSALGVAGTNQSSLLVYGARPGTTCHRCGSKLKRIVVGQRGSTICPRCQRLR